MNATTLRVDPEINPKTVIAEARRELKLYYSMSTDLDISGEVQSSGTDSTLYERSQLAYRVAQATVGVHGAGHELGISPTGKFFKKHREDVAMAILDVLEKASAG